METKVLKNKKVNDINLKTSEDYSQSRLYAEFYSDDKKFVMQKSFQNTFAGKAQLEEFTKTIKSLDDLKKRLGYRA